ncbi:hypothetical protein [uncultured Luteimonas sp.]|uniref:hypothetical protein n=1 Tax=uncultured Luteimonas sp. TaxID=453144 RepID=UPI002628CC00|nr:hypothetical protein [uncultured Luteimonas sp.]
MALDLVEGTGREIIEATRAILENRFGDHVNVRLGAGERKATAFVRQFRKQVPPLIRELQNDPKKFAPDLLIVGLSFYLAGGGFDGDGGIPDSDITFLGIGAHRSIFTHSILAGAVVETTLYSLVDFVVIAHRHLPDGHDPRWTLIHERFEEAAVSGAKGTSLGLAYHLGVDSVIQPGAYHDLPFEMPMIGHQALLGANAIAELADTGHKKAGGRFVRTAQTIAAEQRAKPAEAVKEGRNKAELVAGAAALAALILGFG